MAEADVVDVRGRTVLPGLIDTHVHATLMDRASLPLFLAAGVTAVRDVGGALDKTLALRADLSDPGFDRDSFLALLKRYFGRQNLGTDWDALGQADDELLINSISMLSPFDVEDKQALLEAPRLPDRRETLTALMEFALLAGNGTEETRQ